MRSVAVRMFHDAFRLDAAIEEAVALAREVAPSHAPFVRSVRPVPEDAIPSDAYRILQIRRRCVGWSAGCRLLLVSDWRPPEVFGVTVRRTAAMIAEGRPTPLRGAGGSTASLVPTAPGRGIVTMGAFDPWDVEIVDGPIPGIDIHRAAEAASTLVSTSPWGSSVSAEAADALEGRLSASFTLHGIKTVR